MFHWLFSACVCVRNYGELSGPPVTSILRCSAEGTSVVLGLHSRYKSALRRFLVHKVYFVEVFFHALMAICEIGTT